MAREVKAHLFWVAPVNSSPDTVKKVVVNYMKSGKAFEFTHRSHGYVADELSWDAKRSILSGTVYRIRSSGLPVAVKGTSSHPLPLQLDEALGEPMCFAFWPDPGGALIHYSHNGPRHSVMSSLLSKMGYLDPIDISPLIRVDMLQQLQSKRHIRKIQFALSDPDGMQELRDMGGAVGQSLKMVKELGAVNIDVEITMGHSRGEGLIPDVAKAIAKRLTKLGMAEPDEHAHVRTVKIKGSDGEDSPLQELDMLRAREWVPLLIDESGKHMDRSDCQKKLAASLHDRKSKFTEQLPS